MLVRRRVITKFAIASKVIKLPLDYLPISKLWLAGDLGEALKTL
jgi:hypothetical protein